jgi:hypothetical protein|tara:strand:+ start:387 stop:560 length:174 start_codon:yes stop_codon:yes gene_type:complete
MGILSKLKEYIKKILGKTTKVAVKEVKEKAPKADFSVSVKKTTPKLKVKKGKKKAKK